MRIYTWGMAGTLLMIPFYEFQLHLVPLIPHSAISKTVLLGTLIYHIIFTRVENQPLKQRFKQKRTFSHSLSYRNIFCLVKEYTFLFNYNIPVASMSMGATGRQVADSRIRDLNEL